jgi:sulfur-oxidizing protein SoxY
VASVALLGLADRVRRSTRLRRQRQHPDEAFKQKSSDDAIKLLYGKTAEKSVNQARRARDRREWRGGADRGEFDAIRRDRDRFWSPRTRNALVAAYKILRAMPSVANRIKMARTSNVIVVVEAGGKPTAPARSQSHRWRLRRLIDRQGQLSWHQPFAYAPPRPAKPPKSRR